MGILTTKSNEVASGAVSSYTYAVNQLGQRTQVSQAGSAFATAQSIEWGYDPLGQVTEADHSTDNSQDRNFGYDQIGNRITATEGSNPAQNYTSNALNQYDSIDGQPLSYDPDGNLLSDGQRTYTWDGERCEQTSIVDRSKATCPKGQNAKNESFDQNRLLGTTEASNSATAQYEYDYLSRRVKKTEGADTTTYLYEGWNPVLQTKNGTEQTRYSWGMDLSGSMQGAGGVGGLLSVHKSNGLSGYPTYDGNGNVSEYLDTAGTTIAHYEYDAFGKTTVKTGAQADSFEHRFSTKPIEKESGLYYYGYRYYDPKTGRWPSRDPIYEILKIFSELEKEINIYVFVNNKSISFHDKFGLLGCNYLQHAACVTSCALTGGTLDKCIPKSFWNPSCVCIKKCKKKVNRRGKVKRCILIGQTGRNVAFGNLVCLYKCPKGLGQIIVTSDTGKCPATPLPSRVDMY